MAFLLIGALAVAGASTDGTRFADFNDRGVSFGHVHLVVEDIELHKKLWPRLFDAKLVEKKGYAAVRLSNALIFFRDAAPKAPSAKTVVDHFGLRVRDLNRVLSRWRAEGYEVESRAKDERDRSVAFITMPGGVRLALHERPDQAAPTSMGHVQFVTPTRAALERWYAERFGAKAARAGVSEVPGAELSFESSKTARLPTDGAAIDHLGFEVRDWDGFIAGLRKNNVKFEFGPVHVESLDLWVAFFNDPSGALVEVTHGLDKF